MTLLIYYINVIYTCTWFSSNVCCTFDWIKFLNLPFTKTNQFNASCLSHSWVPLLENLFVKENDWQSLYSCREYQFVWTSDVETVESLLIEHVATPFILVFDPPTRLAYANSSACQHSWTDLLQVQSFMAQVKEGKVPVCLLFPYNHSIFESYFSLFHCFHESCAS